MYENAGRILEIGHAFQARHKVAQLVCLLIRFAGAPAILAAMVDPLLPVPLDGALLLLAARVFIFKMLADGLLILHHLAAAAAKDRSVHRRRLQTQLLICSCQVLLTCCRISMLGGRGELTQHAFAGSAGKRRIRMGLKQRHSTVGISSVCLACIAATPQARRQVDAEGIPGLTDLLAQIVHPLDRTRTRKWQL